jgi:hypothetical protein
MSIHPIFSRLLIGAMLVAFPLILAGQQDTKPTEEQPGKSLADLAKEAKKSKAAPAAKKVVTNDDIVSQHGPLPSIKFDDDDNSEDIVEAITNYRRTHRPEEAEQAIHDWFDDYDSILRATIKSQTQNMSLQQSMNNYTYRACQDSSNYSECMARSRGIYSNVSNGFPSDSGATIMRIQGVFHRVRDSLMRDNVKYKWFKIRTSNGYM